MSVKERLVTEILDLLFPQVCISCGEYGEGILCRNCLAAIVAREDGRKRFNADFDAESPGFPEIRYGGLYGGVIKEMVLKLKGSKSVYAVPLCDLMIVACGNDPAFVNPDFVCYVPSSRSKIALRGYNPALLLAEGVSKGIGRPVLHALSEKGKMIDQDRLTGSMRRKNVVGKFVSREDVKPGSNILLVDDVYTTGATALECCRVLRSIGAGSVRILVAARAGG